MKKTLAIIAGAALFGLAASQAQAATYTYQDNWINWPGYDFGNTQDTIDFPDIDNMVVVVDDATNYLTSITINLDGLGDNRWAQANSLMINSYNMTTTNSAWDDWDFLIHDGGTAHNSPSLYNGTPVDVDGIYSVSPGYEYTTVTWPNRVGNPNGIDAAYLNYLSSLSITGGENGYTYQTFDLSGLNIDVSDGFFVAYTEWCANDVIGGGVGTPEPATMLLFGTGLIGLVGISRKRSK